MTRLRRLMACALVAFACAVAALVLAPSVLGYRAYTVLSGSMRPAIAPGAVVVTKDVPVTAVHRGDIVTLSTPNGTRLVTHRVESLRNTPTGVDVTTKGDANSRDEHWLVAPAGRVQRVVLRVGELGYLGAFLREPLVVLLLLLPALWFVLRGLLRRRRAIENQPVALGVPLALGAVLLAGLSLAAGTYATFTAATSNASTLSSAADWTAPTITRAVIERTDTDKGAGYIKQAQAYYVYAYVTDSGNPASGVSTVTANVGNVTAGQTAVSLSSGSWTINGLAYNYRSGSKTADNPLAEGATSYSVTATDGASNSTTNSSLSVTVDNTAPAISRSVIQDTGGGGAGTILQGASYYVYAQVDDSSSGIDTVSADVSSVTSGQTAVALSTSGGPWTVGGLSYNYRSASKTADGSAGARVVLDHRYRQRCEQHDELELQCHDHRLGLHAANNQPGHHRAHRYRQRRGLPAPEPGLLRVREVTDASGVSSVSADVSTVTAGQNRSVAVDGGGPWTVNGQSYNYRSASKTADNPLAEGAKSYSISATDTVANNGSANFTVWIDNTGPSVSLATTATSHAYFNAATMYYKGDTTGSFTLPGDGKRRRRRGRLHDVPRDRDHRLDSRQRDRERLVAVHVVVVLVDGEPQQPGELHGDRRRCRRQQRKCNRGQLRQRHDGTLRLHLLDHVRQPRVSRRNRRNLRVELQGQHHRRVRAPSDVGRRSLGWRHRRVPRHLDDGLDALARNAERGGRRRDLLPFSWTANPTSPNSAYIVTGTDQVGNSASGTSIFFQSDNLPPTITIGTQTRNGAIYRSANTTMYYKGNTTGNFTLRATPTDFLEPTATITFPDVSTTGWTHASETVDGTNNVASVSSSFSWTASPNNPTSYTVTATDSVGNSGTATISFVSDTTGPAVSLATGSTNHAYLNTGTNTMYYKGNTTGSFTLQASLTDGGAGVTGGATSASFPDISTTGWTHSSETVTSSSPVTSSSFSYTSSPNNPSSYTVTATDAVGNSTTATAVTFTNDTTGPTVTHNALSGATRAYLNTSSTTMYYKGDSTGNFTLAPSVSDAGSGAASRDVPVDCHDGWTHSNETQNVVSGVATSSSFSWTASPNDPGSYTVTATDNVGNTTNATAVTFTSDTTGPTVTHNAFSGATRAYLNTSSTTMYYKGDSTGNFTLAPSVSDAASGAAERDVPVDCHDGLDAQQRDPERGGGRGDVVVVQLDREPERPGQLHGHRDRQCGQHDQRDRDHVHERHDGSEHQQPDTHRGQQRLHHRYDLVVRRHDDWVLQVQHRRDGRGRGRDEAELPGDRDDRVDPQHRGRDRLDAVRVVDVQLDGKPDQPVGLHVHRDRQCRQHVDVGDHVRGGRHSVGDERHHQRCRRARRQGQDRATPLRSRSARQ